MAPQLDLAAAILGVVLAFPVEGDGERTLTLGQEVELVDAIADLGIELHELESLGWLDEDSLEALILLALGDDILDAVRWATLRRVGGRLTVSRRVNGPVASSFNACV